MYMIHKPRFGFHFKIVLLLEKILDSAQLLVKLEILLRPYGPNPDKAVATSATITRSQCYLFFFLFNTALITGLVLLCVITVHKLKSLLLILYSLI
jgi:hypothetical protein